MYMKLKEMQYGSNTSEVIARGQSDYNSDVKFIVINCRGSHMCAYVTFPGIEEVTDYDDFYVDDGVVVHGGFTFLGQVACAKDGVKYIGWDYAHYGDYTYPGGLFSGEEHKWTVDEVIEQAEEVADAIANGKPKDVIVMVSMPCHGRSDEELDAIVERLNDDARLKVKFALLLDANDINTDTEYVHFIRNSAASAISSDILDVAEHKRLLYVGSGISTMAVCDAVYFMDGWASAKGCLVEKLACDLYDIPHIIERKED